MKHLCIVIDRETKKEITSYEIDAKDWYYARHQARILYEKETTDRDNWYVDSMEI